MASKNASGSTDMLQSWERIGRDRIPSAMMVEHVRV